MPFTRGSFSWSSYCAGLLNQPNPECITVANNVYNSYSIGVNYWIRPNAPSAGLTACIVNPWRKYGWEYTPSASFTWLMTASQIVSNLKNDELIGVKIFPNPASDILTLQKVEKQKLEIDIINTQDKKLKSFLFKNDFNCNF
jgi:hypothetical protein